MHLTPSRTERPGIAGLDENCGTNTGSMIAHMAGPSGPQVLTFALDNWPHKSGPSTRASKPKVRTGCITCKRRRVKCDEAKPTCQNCVKRRIVCEGYKDKSQQNNSPKKQLARNDWGPLLIEPNYQGLVFATQLQRDHFDQWLSFADATLVFPSELITGTIPQIAHSDPAVKNAAFAIGAASLGSSTREQRLLGTGPYYADALEYYNRALKLTMKSAATDDTLDTVLMTCLMFFMFEALQGNRRAALLHINHGFNILDQYERRVGRVRTPLVEAIIANFKRLTLQSWSHNGDHPKETKNHVPWCCRGRTQRYAVDEMPDTFDTLDDAHRWWETTQHHIIHHAPLIIGFRVEGTGNTTPAQDAANGGPPISPERVKSHIRFVERWRARFLPLLKKVQGSKGMTDREHLKVLGLRLHSVYLSIPIKTANYTDRSTLAVMTPNFLEVVALSEEFLQIQQSRGNQAAEVFTMDSNSPTWPLGAAAMLCVDPKVRAHAVRLLREYPRRDGLWDTHTFVAMLHQFGDAQRMIKGRVGEEEEKEEQEEDQRHRVFDYEVVYEEKSVTWVKMVEDPSAVSRDALEYRIELP